VKNLQIKIKNWNINFEVQGEGEPVILLHGWLTDLESMRPLTTNLVKKFKVYLVDVVGFGKSDLPNEPLNSNDFAEFLKEFMEKLNIENPVLIGHSNGGRIIINAVGKGIVKAKKIVLIDSAGIKPKRSTGYYVKLAVFKTGKLFLNLLPNTKSLKEFKERLRNKVGSSDYKASPTVLKDTMKIIVNEDVKEILPNIKVPTLLIWGSLDTATPIEDARTMEKLIPDCGIVEYPYGTHFSYLENIENCKLVLDSFLN
jgi:pimeloyl-ACP methyl ester carboxylesterase